jgi:hypothetical protein
MRAYPQSLRAQIIAAFDNNEGPAQQLPQIRREQKVHRRAATQAAQDRVVPRPLRWVPTGPRFKDDPRYGRRIEGKWEELPSELFKLLGI